MFCPPFRLAVSWKQPRREHGTFSRDAALKVTGVSSAGLCGDGDSPGGRRCLCLSFAGLLSRAPISLQ